jgi:hypothetical protein
MARPFFPHEADDPDLDWLVSNFLYERPDYLPVETGMLPLVLIPYRQPESDSKEKSEPAELLPPKAGE